MKQQITLLDGGMGQELCRRSGKPASPLFSTQAMIDNPDMVVELHSDYIRAGADVICLNAYASTPERLHRDADISLFEPLQKAAAAAALKARDQTQKSVLIAGCLPPLMASYHAELIPEEAQAIESYERIVKQQETAVDLFIAETMSSISEAHYVCRAVAKTSKSIWVSFTVDDSDGTLLRSGEALKDGIKAAVAANAECILVNCSSPESIRQAMPILSKNETLFGGMANTFVSAAKLKAGETVDTLVTRNDLGPDEYAAHALSWVEDGATLIGGCCGVGPGHIAEIRRRIDMISSQ
ncbi:MAG: homocysteine S-methyltransferase [Rhodospirillaceae bacterium TMED8]|nr:homocysteine S-methyltransferase [Magnetovibrio sp.]OUT47802.1 MAG: homocysteine S-methyltransferase [Rhodospirillaceae bacterium TMED8]|tara:strand:+ start:1931 stop:2821 length:891 start_codon:yes stop_codon:yes gene_type:complete